MRNGTHVNLTGLTKAKKKKPAYLRISAGPQRNEYVHRLVAMALLRRPLQPHETVDHIDQNPLNCAPENLQVLSWSEHGKVTRSRSNGKRAGLEGTDYEVILRGKDVYVCPDEQ